MTKAKENFGKMVENQQQLTEKLKETTTKFAEMFVPNREEMEKGQEIFTEYLNKTRELLEAGVKPENIEKFWEKMPEQYNKMMEIQLEYFNKTLDYYRKSMENFNWKIQQDNLRKVTESYQNMYNMFFETTNANMKIMQEFFA